MRGVSESMTYRGICKRGKGDVSGTTAHVDGARLQVPASILYVDGAKDVVSDAKPYMCHIRVRVGGETWEFQ